MKKHTDSGFTFDFKEDHAAVMEIDGDPQIVEIPEQIDGVPVTELAEYLFSGKSCQVIRIPLGVQKIRAERDPFRSWGGAAGTFIWKSGSHALVSGIL